jgi:hypothetical protein
MKKDYVKFIKPSGKVASKELIKNLRDHKIEPPPEDLHRTLKKLKDPAYYDSLLKNSKTKKYGLYELQKINNREFILASQMKERNFIIPRQEFLIKVVRTPVILITRDYNWLIYGRDTLYYNEKKLKNTRIIVTEINARRFFDFIRTTTT